MGIKTNAQRGSILDEKSGLCSCEQGNKTDSLLTKRTTNLPDLSLKDNRASPKIGIVIPIYNVAPYLRECLDSVANQTYGNFEVCLVNDGSTDILDGESKSESLKIALEYVAKDCRFVLIDKENGGLSSARNVGIDYFGGNLSLTQSLRELEKSAFDRHLALSQADFPTQPTNLTQDTRIANDSKDSSLRGSLSEAKTTKQSKTSDLKRQNESKLERQINKSKSNKTTDSLFGHYDSYNLDSRVLDCHDFADAKSRNDGRGDSLLQQNDSSNLTPCALDSSLRALHFAQNDEVKNSPSLAEGVRGWVKTTLAIQDTHPLCPPPQGRGNNQMTLYTHPNHTNLNPPKIDYIIFLDSDDFWESDLLESCVDLAQNYNSPDIIWFDWREIYESKTPPKYQSQTMLELFGFTNQTQITAIEWLNRAKSRHIYQFWWAWQGLIRFDYLKRVNLRFLEGIIFEDNLFGILLFSQCESIAILPRKLYNYRIREGSTMTKWDFKEAPSYIKPLLAHFDYDMALQYFKSHCHLAIATELQKFCANLTDRRVANLCERTFIPSFLVELCDILTYQNDPYNLKAQFYALVSGRKMDLLYIKIIDNIIPKHLKRVRHYCFLLHFVPYLIVIRGRVKLKNLCYKFKR